MHSATRDLCICNRKGKQTKQDKKQRIDFNIRQPDKSKLQTNSEQEEAITMKQIIKWQTDEN
jgi:hypothetical protein